MHMPMYACTHMYTSIEITNGPDMDASMFIMFNMHVGVCVHACMYVHACMHVHSVWGSSSNAHTNPPPPKGDPWNQ